jgi:hypothetical protein
MGFLTEKEIAELMPSELLPHATPIPTQCVASDEYTPPPQSEKQKEVEARLLAMGDELGARQGLSRREFFQTAAGMAAGFVALNDTFGTVFDVSRAEAATPAMAQERAATLKDQFIMDMHTHFLRDDTRLENFVRSREAVGKAGWNPALVDKPQTLDDLKFNNYFKEIYLDSDTKIALISSSPSEIPRDWFLTNEMMIEARDKVNKEAGSRRMFAHAIFTPGWDGWLDHLEGSLQRKPESIKGYTVGDNTNKDHAKHPWRMDDEKVTYKAYELCVKHGIKNVCVHKGLFRRALPATARLCGRARRRQGGEGLAAAQLHHLSQRLSSRRRGPRGRRLERVRADRARLLGQRSRGDPGKIRRHQRLRRRRATVRPERRRRATSRRRPHGHHGQGHGL